ncbi:hypothetical protein DOO74_17290 [Rhodobacteraceae bacterium AsT-22]|nr:hypothetical protein DOO74_17290 [Rhodobacteraceae bacterium AsT-22]
MRFDLLESTIESSTLSQESIILLGGPIANNVAKHFWPEVEKRVPYAISLETQSISSANATYEPKEDADGLLSVDYSLVVKMRRNSGKFLFLFAGCHGFGTSGSTRIVSDPDLVRDLAKRVGDREFVAIVKSTINKGIVDAVEVVDAYNFA